VSDYATVDDLVAKRVELLDAFLSSQQTLENAKKAYFVAKKGLTEFNSKYGRVLEVMEEAN
jgi:hypothetical protein